MQNLELYNFALTVTIVGVVMFAVLHSRKLKLCRGHMFSNVVKIMMFISDIQYYVPIELCKTARIKLKLYLGYLRNRFEGGQHDF